MTPADFVARHPSGKNLSDIADVTIDNHVPHGDTVMKVEGQPQTVGAVSTMLVSFCVQWLVMETVERCAALGLVAPVWQSANTVGGDGANDLAAQCDPVLRSALGRSAHVTLPFENPEWAGHSTN